VIETQVSNQGGAEFYCEQLRPELVYNEAGKVTLKIIVTCTVVSVAVSGILGFLEDKQPARRFEAHIAAIGLSTADKNDLQKLSTKIRLFVFQEKSRIQQEIREKQSSERSNHD
jgi:hypothetical protein